MGSPMMTDVDDRECDGGRPEDREGDPEHGVTLEDGQLDQDDRVGLAHASRLRTRALERQDYAPSDCGKIEVRQVDEPMVASTRTPPKPRR